MSKLPPEEQAFIAQRLLEGEYAFELATEYGVSREEIDACRGLSPYRKPIAEGKTGGSHPHAPAVHTGPDGEVLVKTRECAAMLGYKPNTLLKMIKSGRVPCVRLGKRTIRFSISAVRQALETNKPTRRPVPLPKRK